MATLENVRSIGVSTIGDGKHQAIFHIKTIPVPDKPSILALDAVADSTGVRETFYFWVDSTGDLRTGSAIPTDQNGSGVVVGTQEA